MYLNLSSVNRIVLSCKIYINLYRKVNVHHGIILFLNEGKISSLSKTLNRDEVTQRLQQRVNEF